VLYITLRSTGYNNIHVKAAKRFGLKVANAPDYSSHAIAEHTVALLMAINRKIDIAVRQVRSYNFEQKNLLGFDLVGKTIGIIGTGRIGSLMVKIMHAFGCKILAHDLFPKRILIEQFGVEYVDVVQLYRQSDVISLHVPLTQDTHYMLNETAFKKMKPDVLLINTARGAVVDTRDLIKALKENLIAGYAADVYENEKGIFFKDNSKKGISDDNLKTLLSFKNVLITPHQAFITKEALSNIAEITFANINCWARGESCENELGYETLVL
jgi:D-lactate dehydrogenase